MRSVKVRARAVGTIPLAEVSGLAHGSGPSGNPVLIAIGDRAGAVAWASTELGMSGGSWETVELGSASGTRIEDGAAQLEALAADGAGGVLLVQEAPNRAELVVAAERRVVAEIALVMPDIPDAVGYAPLRESWLDPDSSHAEGVVLLREGRLLVVKEKDPSALVEFGPAGQLPAGFGPDRWLAPDEAWAVGEGEVALVALAAWYPDQDLARACPDLSDADVGGGDLVLLSDKGSAFAVVGAHDPASDPFDGRVSADVVVRVKGLADKPEGLVVLPDGDVLIACDMRAVDRQNLFLVAGSDWNPPGT
jgi:hypothetical protein